MVDFVKKTKAPLTHDLDLCYGLAHSYNATTLIWINDVKNKPDDVLDTIIHESVHIWQNIAKYMCEEEPGIEMEAYSIAFISSTLIKEYRRLVALKEQDNAVHEEREEGLQEGECPVQLEAGTNQKPLGTDDSSEAE